MMQTPTAERRKMRGAIFFAIIARSAQPQRLDSSFLLAEVILRDHGVQVEEQGRAGDEKAAGKADQKIAKAGVRGKKYGRQDEQGRGSDEKPKKSECADLFAEHGGDKDGISPVRVQQKFNARAPGSVPS
ncbi:hypothetical protein [Silvibacterium sp.]|uniref:hypothetical protein n=1 Tax=Silvibacterium sp. TaxID=1964179 RepID=UPI0039E5E818